MVLYGDVPLLRRETLEELVGTARRYGCLAIVTATPPDPSGYGRILRDQRGTSSASSSRRTRRAEELAITEINAGIYCGPRRLLPRGARGLGAQQRAGRVLPDRHHRARGGRIGVSAVEAALRRRRWASTIAQQLAEAEATLRARINRALAGARHLPRPGSTVVEPGVDDRRRRRARAQRRAARQTRDRPRRAHRRRRHPHRHRGRRGRDDQAVHVATERASAPARRSGPFAHLRPGSALGADVHIGNFVETKKTELGRAARPTTSRISATPIIGEKVNIGAGTITCNYNGYEKHQTVIEDGAFIGSDTQLVAPVRVGKRAVVAAGTTVTRDVPPARWRCHAPPRSKSPATRRKSRNVTAERRGVIDSGGNAPR